MTTAIPTCAHTACRCRVAVLGEYCSDFCQRADTEARSALDVQQGCACGHHECAGSEASVLKNGAT